MIRVGIVDSGVPVTGSSNARVNIVDAADFSDSDNCDDFLGHSTVVSEAIAAAGDVDFVHAKVFGQRLACPASSVVRALAWLFESDVQVINMSFGMARADSAMRVLLDQIRASGITVVAASPAQGGAVYPAAFPGVIRATGDARCAPDQISFLDSEQADFGGCVGNPTAGVAGASIGCAHVVRTVCELLTRDRALTPEQVYQGLKECARWRGREYKVLG